MKKLKNILVVIVIFLVGLSCSTNSSQEDGSSETNGNLKFSKMASNDINPDSVTDLTLGDCFLIDSSAYGFICYELLGPNTSALVPVKLDLKGVNTEKFVNGTIRLVGRKEDKYPECLHIWSKDEKHEFLTAYEKVGNIKLNDKRPAVKSYQTMLEYNHEGIDKFIWFQNNTYTEKIKIYPSVKKFFKE